MSSLASPLIAKPPADVLVLANVPDGASAFVERLVARSPSVDAASLRRLGDIGFIPGEPVRVVRRGPGGREPLAVVIGQTMFALRFVEAECVEVRLA
jgi:ferrous iron transport protein A